MMGFSSEPHSPLYMGSVLNNVVFGFTDGLITDTAVVAGMVAYSTDTLSIVVIAAIAATLAGAMSMFLGAYIAAYTRFKFTMREKRLEEKEVEQVPQVEKQEVREIYLKHGFTPEETEVLVNRVTSDKELWIKTMMREELGFGEDDMSKPVIAREAVIGLAFFVGSFIPIIPFLVVTYNHHFLSILSLSDTASAFVVALVLSAIGLAVLGAFKERFGEGKPLKGAVQMLLVGLGGAAVVYLIITGITSLIPH
jgi:VIT1/CCC1 family predicted Fe2+/Mn2+ transporter